MRGGIAALMACLLLVCASCGQTDYATDVTEDGAQLKGTITTLTEDVDTAAWFEYWPTANPANKQQTPDQNVTTTGPLSAVIGGLANYTEYQYRLCATEDDSPAVCAQTRRLTTGRDTVQAYGESEHSDETAPASYWFEDIGFDLVAGASGVSGAGFLEYHNRRVEHHQYDVGGPSAEITCFEVSANTAIVGLRRSESAQPQGFVQLVDGGALGSGQDTLAVWINGVFVGERDPSDCSTPLDNPLPLKSGEIVINEAQPGPT